MRPPYPIAISRSHIHELDGLAKSALFQHAEPVSQQESNRATDILARLQVLSPSLAKDFKPREDSMQNIPFRLLNHGVDLSTPEVSYIALSYCWAENNATGGGAESRAQQAISLKDESKSNSSEHPLPCSPLLFKALLNERSFPHEGIWIDAVCINQQDAGEKYKAINAMNIVYQSARETTVLLDDIEVTVSEHSFLKAYLPLFESSAEQPLHDCSTPEPMASNPIFLGFLAKILQARWFSRAWCNHEMRLSRSLIFLMRCECTPTQPSVIRLTGLFLFFLINRGMDSGLGHQLPENVWHVSRVLLPSTTTAKRANQHVHSLMEIFAEVFALTAGGDRTLSEDKRHLDGNLDKIHIAINTAGIGLSYIRAASVKDERILPTREECCRKFTILALAARDPITLCTSGPLMHCGGCIRSWLSWPMPRDIQHGLEVPELLPDSAVRAMKLDTSPAAEYISLDLMVLDASTDTREPSKPFLARAKDVLDACKEQGMEIGSLTPEYLNSGIELWTSSFSQPIDRIAAATSLHTRCLACVLECGPAWAAWVSQRLPQSSPYDIEIISNGVAAFMHGTFQSFIQQSRNRVAVEAVLHMIGHIIRRAVAWETTEHSWMMWQPRLISSVGGGGKLLIFDRLEAHLLTAVPTCLVHQQYWHFFRGWTVVPVSHVQLAGSGSTGESVGDGVGAAYCLVAKTRVFGRIELEDDRLRYGTLKKGVRIYGMPYHGP